MRLLPKTTAQLWSPKIICLRQYKVIPRATEAEGLPVLVLMTEAINAAMVTHALLVADAAKPFFEVHLASFGGAYAKLLEQSEFQSPGSRKTMQEKSYKSSSELQELQVFMLGHDCSCHENCLYFVTPTKPDRPREVVFPFVFPLQSEVSCAVTSVDRRTK